VTDLGTPPFAVTDLFLDEMSSDGAVAVGQAFTTTRILPFRWSLGGKLVDLSNDPYHMYNFDHLAVRPDGAMTFATRTSLTSPRIGEVVRWNDAPGILSLGVLPNLTSCGVMRHGVTADGTIAVGTCYSPDLKQHQGFRWTEAAGMKAIALPPGYSTGEADEMTADGSVVLGVIKDAGGNSQLYRWTEATGTVALGPLPGYTSTSLAYPFGMSADGSVIVGTAVAPGQKQAFRWTAATGIVALGFLPGHAQSEASSVSADGSAVGGQSSGAGGEPTAVVWQGGAASNLAARFAGAGIDLHGFRPTRSNVATGDPRVVWGTGINQGGETRAFIGRVP
jgi:probable HAF family extracellular repeat protein